MSAKAGYVLIPVEPTEEMASGGRQAYENTLHEGYGRGEAIRDAYAAMLSAAPPPKPTGNQEDSVSQSQPISDGHMAATSDAASANSERSEADYAIEFGAYLATAATAFLNAINDHSAFGRGDITVDDLDALNDCRKDLRSAIYEFDKRRIRALRAAHAGPEGLGVPQDDPDPSPKPSGDGLVDREVIARVIDPAAWWPENDTPKWKSANERAQHVALTKADEIITLLGGRSDSSALSQPKSTLHGAHTEGGGAGS